MQIFSINKRALFNFSFTNLSNLFSNLYTSSHLFLAQKDYYFVIATQWVVQEEK